MTKFKIVPNMLTYRNPRVYSMSDPKKDGVLIRWLDFSHTKGYIVWDDEYVWTHTVPDHTQVNVELCELDHG